MEKRSEEKNATYKLLEEIENSDFIKSKPLKKFFNILAEFLKFDRERSSVVFCGLDDDIVNCIRGTVLSRELEFVSLCEDSLLPFFGVVTVKYRLEERFISLGTIKRIVENATKRLTFQEKALDSIRRSMENLLEDKSVFSICIDAYHLCVLFDGGCAREMKIRTVYKNGKIDD